MDLLRVNTALAIVAREQLAAENVQLKRMLRALETESGQCACRRCLAINSLHVSVCLQCGERFCRRLFCAQSVADYLDCGKHALCYACAARLQLAPRCVCGHGPCPLCRQEEHECEKRVYLQ